MYIYIGTIEVILRTSDGGRFPGFSATVVCVSTTLLPQTAGKNLVHITERPEKHNNSKCLIRASKVYSVVV